MTPRHPSILYTGFNPQITSKGIIFHIFHTARTLVEVKQWIFGELSLHLGTLLKTNFFWLTKGHNAGKL